MSNKKNKYKSLKKREALGEPKLDKKKAVILFVAVFLVAAVIIGGAIGFDYARKKANTVTNSDGLNSEGKVKGIKVNDYIDLCDLDKIDKTVENYYPDAETEKTYIDGIVSSYPVLNEDKNKVVNIGDNINIDFVTYIDGQEMAGGNTNGAGIKIPLGAAGYPEDFEEQIAGHKVGEEFDVIITFANDFANEELAGKEATYKVTINGLYENDEFNDAFIKRNFGSQLSSAEEFLAAYRESAAENNFDSYITQYIISDSTVKKTPSNYKKNVIKILKDKDVQQMENTNEAYENLYQMKMYQDVLDMRQMTAEEYDAYLSEKADEEIKTMLVYQALYEKFGLSINQDDLYEVAKSYSYEQDEYDQAVERFGEPYIRQQAMYKVVTTYLTENYNLK